MKKNLLISIWMTLATTVLLGIVYPLAVTGLAQCIFSAAGKWRADSSRWKADWLAPDRTAVYFAGIFSFAAIGGRAGWIRRHAIGRIESRADESGADCARAGRLCKQMQADNPGVPVPVDLGDDFRLRSRSRYFARGCGFSGAARGPRTRDERRRCARAREETYPGTAAGLPRRASRECAGAEYRAGCGAPASLSALIRIALELFFACESRAFFRLVARSDSRSRVRCGCSADGAGPAQFSCVVD